MVDDLNVVAFFSWHTDSSSLFVAVAVAVPAAPQLLSGFTLLGAGAITSPKRAHNRFHTTKSAKKIRARDEDGTGPKVLQQQQQ